MARLYELRGHRGADGDHEAVPLLHFAVGGPDDPAITRSEEGPIEVNRHRVVAAGIDDVAAADWSLAARTSRGNSLYLRSVGAVAIEHTLIAANAWRARGSRHSLRALRSLRAYQLRSLRRSDVAAAANPA